MGKLWGVCSFEEDVEEFYTLHKIHFYSRGFAISDERAKYSYREGCFICITGETENLEKIKEFYGIKDNQEEKILLSLYLILGKTFISLLTGNFIIVIYDEVEKELLLFTDKSNKNELYIAKRESFFLFADSPAYILSDPVFPSVIDEKGILRLFSAPYAYTGEAIRGMYRIHGNEYVRISENGIDKYTYDIKINESMPDKAVIKFPEKGDSFIYSSVKEGHIYSRIPPHIMASAIKEGSFSNGHLLLLNNCKGIYDIFNRGYPFEEFLSDYRNNLLCDLDYFDYDTVEDIERAENLFLYYNLFIKPTEVEIYRICTLYGIKNNSDLYRPESLKALYNNNKEKMLYSACNALYLAQDIKKMTAKLCQNEKEPVFDIISRHKLYSVFTDAEESFLLFIIRFNLFLKEFKPILEL